MFLKLICLCSVVACVLAKPSPADVVPLEKQQPTVIPIISQSEELEPNGTYKFSYETGNGIKREETSYDKVVPKAKGRSAGSEDGSGSEESDEIHVQQGSYSYTAPDGTVITVRYIADENGFRPIGDHLPKAPAFVQQQIDASAKEKTGRSLNVDSDGSPSTPAGKSEIAPSPAEVKPEPVPLEIDSKSQTAVPADASLKLAATSESSTDSAEKPAAVEVSFTAAPSEAASTVLASTTAAESTESSSTTASSEAISTVASELLSSTQGQTTTTEAVSSEAIQSSSNVSTTETASPTIGLA